MLRGLRAAPRATLAGARLVRAMRGRKREPGTPKGPTGGELHRLLAHLHAVGHVRYSAAAKQSVAATK